MTTGRIRASAPPKLPQNSSDAAPIFRFASTPSQPSLPEQDMVVTHRPILQSIPPSKRAITETSYEITVGILDDANKSLPKQLAQNDEDQQCSELDQHTPTMTCVDAINNFESTLSGLSKDIEEDDATAINEHPHQAIPQYSEPESVHPPPPPIPSNSRPVSRKDSGKNEAQANKVDVPELTPTSRTSKDSVQLPSNPINTNQTLDTVTHNDHKNSCATDISKVQSISVTHKQAATRKEPGRSCSTTQKPLDSRRTDNISSPITSDHLPILGPALSQKQLKSAARGPIRVARDQLPRFALVVSRWVPPLTPINSVKDIEEFAEELCGTLKQAIKAVGRRPNPGNGRSAPWWNPECKVAQLKCKGSVTECERLSNAKNFKKVVAAAKRSYCKSQEERAQNLTEHFKLQRWGSPKHAEIPPLLHEDRIISDQAERASILLDCFLSRHQVIDDHPRSHPGEAWIPWDEEISEAEIQFCTIGKGSPCAGLDGISTELLASCWSHIEAHVTHLFRACIHFGHHPSCFKQAEIVFLPKAGSDLSTAEGWKPIALLSCLGKGLERIMAKRMSHFTVALNVVGPQQSGALSKWSATDLVLCVTHDVEEARAQGLASTFVTSDEQGAFDAVLHNQLIWRMQAQGWPDSVIRWTTSFLKDRSVQVRYPGGITNPRKLVCGLPQGSPISPILFLLNVVDPMHG